MICGQGYALYLVFGLVREALMNVFKQAIKIGNGDEDVPAIVEG
jgi:hypothetical protein